MLRVPHAHYVMICLHQVSSSWNKLNKLINESFLRKINVNIYWAKFHFPEFGHYGKIYCGFIDSFQQFSFQSPVLL